jgi:hypothetical protein
MTAQKKKSSDNGAIELRRLEDGWLEVPITGLTPVIPHRWSEKAKEMMPGHPASEGKVKGKKGVRLPEEEAEACVYRLPDGRPGIPATAFKAAIIGACRFFDKPSMTEAKLLIFVEGEGPEQLVPIAGTPVLREDTPRNSNGSADLRYRYAFHDWRAVLRVRFVPTSLTAGSVVTLVDAAGRGGVCDWRPSAPKSPTGTYGTWRVTTEEGPTDVPLEVAAPAATAGERKRAGRKEVAHE